MEYTVGQVRALLALFLVIFVFGIAWVNTTFTDDDIVNRFFAVVTQTGDSIADPLGAVTDQARELREEIDTHHTTLYEASLDMDGFAPTN